MIIPIKLVYRDWFDERIQIKMADMKLNIDLFDTWKIHSSWFINSLQQQLKQQQMY